MVFLLVLPFVALAAVLPNQQQDAQKVAQEVKEQVDGFMTGLFMYTSVVFTETPKLMEERVEMAKKEFDTLKEQAKDKFEETKQKVNGTYQEVKVELIKAASDAEQAMKTAQEQLAYQINAFKGHADQTYGDLKDKVKQALNNAHEDLQKMLKLAEERMGSAEMQIDDQLNFYTDGDYESTLYQYPGWEHYGQAVHVLKKGLNKCVNVMKRRVEQVHQEWKTEDVKKIDNDIERTITGTN